MEIQTLSPDLQQVGESVQHEIINLLTIQNQRLETIQSYLGFFVVLTIGCMVIMLAIVGK